MPLGTLANGFRPLISPVAYDDLVLKGGPYLYVRRHLPEAGQEADAFMNLQLLPDSPIGPTYENQRNVNVAEPTFTVNQTIGYQSIGGYVNNQDFATQAIVDLKQQIGALANPMSQFTG
jgi:hypothetical protein